MNTIAYRGLPRTRFTTGVNLNYARALPVSPIPLIHTYMYEQTSCNDDIGDMKRQNPTRHTLLCL